jgi:hypothetical protein
MARVLPSEARQYLAVLLPRAVQLLGIEDVEDGGGDLLVSTSSLTVAAAIDGFKQKGHVAVSLAKPPCSVCPLCRSGRVL